MRDVTTLRPIPLLASLLAVLFPLLLSACGTSDTQLHTDELLFAGLRSSWEFPRGESGSRGVVGFRHGLELDLTGVRGDGELDKGLGRTEFNAQQGSVCYGLGIDVRDFEVRLLGGAAVHRVQLEDAESPSVNGTESYAGMRVGMEARWRARPWLIPYGRLSGALLEGASDSNSFETGVLFQSEEGPGLFVAYRRWNAEYDQKVAGFRDLDVRWTGVMLGLRCDF